MNGAAFVVDGIYLVAEVSLQLKLAQVSTLYPL